MSRILSIVAAVLAWGLVSAAPTNTVLELNGWVLGQHQSALKAHFNAPYKSHDAGPVRNEVYLLDPASKTYMMFSVDESRPTNYILSMQLFGGATKAQRYAFLGLRLGDPAARVREALGAPDATLAAGPLGVTVWKYTKRNYAVEIGTDDKLRSIRLEYWTGLPVQPPKEEVAAPPLKPFTDAIAKRDVDALVKLLMPDIEITLDGDAKSVAGPLRDIIADPGSSIGSRLFNKKVSVTTALANAAGPPEASSRIWQDGGFGWTVRYPSPKSGPQITELVWKYYPGGWRIWEIHLSSKPVKT